MRNGAVPAAALDPVAVYSGRTGANDTHPGLVFSLVVLVFKVKGVDVPGEVAGIRCQCGSARRGGSGEKTHPRMVRQILISKSAPQPATKKAPAGGTGGSVSWCESGGSGVWRTDYGDDDKEDCADHCEMFFVFSGAMCGVLLVFPGAMCGVLG